MKIISLIAVSVLLVGCTSPAAQMDKTREINAAIQSMRLLGGGGADPKFIAQDKCLNVKVETYDNTTGTDSERFTKAQEAQKACMKDSGY